MNTFLHILGLSLITIASASAAAPEVESISPLALRVGAATEVKFSGKNLTAATNVWATFPAKFEPLGEGRFRVTTTPESPVGVGSVRLYGTNGVSMLKFVLLDDMPAVIENGTNKTREAAQSIPAGTAVEGRCEELSYEWFRVSAKKGQRVAVEVVATRLGSRLDSVLRIFDANGKQLAHNDDAPGLRGDSYVSFTAPRDGDYFIELRDVAYAGNSETFYRLRVGDFPLATAAFPAAAPQYAISMFRLAGPAGDVGRTEARTSTSTALPLSIRGASGSTFARALVTSGPEILEREPNDSVSKAMKVARTDGLNGRFDKADDRDCYQFAARKGERLEFRAATRSLGAPCDAMLEIQSADGKTIARSNPAAADEGIVTARFASNGVYRLIVEEAAGAFGPNCIYRIVASPAPGFSLTLDTDRFNVAPGKTFDVKVTAVRDEYKGPVTLSLEGIDSLLWTNNVIAEGKSNATMKVTAPETFAPGAPRFFSVIGTATRDGSEVRARASTAPALRKQFPQMLYVPAEFDGEIVLGVIGK